MGRPIPLIELLPQLTVVERVFFEKLDAELDKVESFYSEREKDMHHRSVFVDRGERYVGEKLTSSHLTGRIS